MSSVCATQLHGSNPASEQLGGVERALGATVPEAAGEKTAQAYIERQALLLVVSIKHWLKERGWACIG